jgi:hypothetical protein
MGHVLAELARAACCVGVGSGAQPDDGEFAVSFPLVCRETGFDPGLTPGDILTVAGSPVPRTADAHPIPLSFQNYLPNSGITGVG